MKNPQTTIAPTFLTHIISGIDGVMLQHEFIMKNQRHLNSANSSFKSEVTLTYKTYSSYSKWWEER